MQEKLKKKKKVHKNHNSNELNKVKTQVNHN